ncbi:hypothetical protein RM647_00765 [Mammaliicoccus sciuri]|nr:hypothetical protein [Mammaliicoccus sciuri]
MGLSTIANDQDSKTRSLAGILYAKNKKLYALTIKTRKQDR